MTAVLDYTTSLNVQDKINNFLDDTGFADQYILIAHLTSNPRTGQSVDIAMLDDEKRPSEEVQRQIGDQLPKFLNSEFPDYDNLEIAFLRTIDGRIPSGGSPAFACLNRKADARRAEIALDL